VSEAVGVTEAPAPGKGHNRRSPPSEAHKLIDKAGAALKAHSTHTRDAIDALRDFLMHIMETCEYAGASDSKATEVVLALTSKGIGHIEGEHDWLYSLVKATYPKDARELEKGNISKYVSVLSYARRQGIVATKLKAFLAKDGNSLSALVGREADARREEKEEANRKNLGDATRTPKPDKFEEEVTKHRQAFAPPEGVTLPEGERFMSLVIERTDKGLWLVAQATLNIKEVRHFFPNLPKLGRKPRNS
jgi:hypothetical protein